MPVAIRESFSQAMRFIAGCPDHCDLMAEARSLTVTNALDRVTWSGNILDIRHNGKHLLYPVPDSDREMQQFRLEWSRAAGHCGRFDWATQSDWPVF